MRRSFGSLIILPPQGPRIHRLRYTRSLIRLMIATALVGLCIIVGVRRALPPIPEAERTRLEQENQSLRMVNKNLEMESKRLQSRVSRLEEASKRMVELVKK